MKNIEYKNMHLNDGSIIEYHYSAPKNNQPVICLLYGLVCNNRHWEYQIDYFLNEGFGLLIHNYRHHFGSTSSLKLKELNFKMMANDLKLLFDQLEIDSAHFIGHSMGVNVCLEFYLNYPEVVSSLSLIAGSPFRPQDTMFNTNFSDYILETLNRLQSISPRVSNLIWKNLYRPKIIRKLVLDGGFNPDFVEDEFVLYYMKKIAELGPELFFHLLKLMKYHNLSASLHHIKIPTLVLGGDKDMIAPITGQIVFHESIKNSEFYLIKDGSHVPQVDFPDSVNNRLHHFIESNL